MLAARKVVTMLLAEAGYNEESHNEAVNAIKSKALTDMAEIVEQLALVYCNLYNFAEPHEINNGMCEDFAADVCRLMPGAELIWNDDLDDKQYFGHCFVLYNGNFYDSECPDGVEDWHDLPFQKRVEK